MEGRYVTIARVRKETQRLKATKLHVTVLQEQTKSDISTKKRQQPHALFRNLSKTIPIKLEDHLKTKLQAYSPIPNLTQAIWYNRQHNHSSIAEAK